MIKYFLLLWLIPINGFALLSLDTKPQDLPKGIKLQRSSVLTLSNYLKIQKKKDHPFTVKFYCYQTDKTRSGYKCNPTAFKVLPKLEKYEIPTSW